MKRAAWAATGTLSRRRATDHERLRQAIGLQMPAEQRARLGSVRKRQGHEAVVHGFHLEGAVGTMLPFSGRGMRWRLLMLKDGAVYAGHGWSTAKAPSHRAAASTCGGDGVRAPDSGGRATGIAKATPPQRQWPVIAGDDPHPGRRPRLSTARLVDSSAHEPANRTADGQ